MSIHQQQQTSIAFNDRGISFVAKQLPGQLRDCPSTTPESQDSWKVGARPQADFEFSMCEETCGQDRNLSPMALRQRKPAMASPMDAKAASPLWQGSEAHRRAHIHSLASLAREALAERLFNEQQMTFRLQEQLVRCPIEHSAFVRLAMAHSRTCRKRIGCT
jgi:hypothetical protein